MTRPVLGDVLLQLVTAVTDAAQERSMLVEQATLDVPLECSVHIERGDVVLRASAPHSRFRSGFLPPVHMSRLRIVALTAPEDG